MTEHELSERLRQMQLPDEAGAQERTWTVIRAAHLAAAPTVARSRRRVAIPAVTGLAAIMILVAIANVPRRAVAAWVRDALGLTALPHARPTLGPLPTGGQVLVTTPSGIWIVTARGARRRLGPGEGATFSPHSEYVAVWRGHELAALDLRGHRQWALSASASVSAVRWSPDGYRIVYFVGRSIMVVAGDGSGAHTLTARASRLAPAWQSGTGRVHRVAFLDARGAIELRDADSGSLIWRARVPARPEQLLWSADGRRLAVLAPHQVTLYSSAGRRLATRSLAGGGVLAGGALAPGGQLALLMVRAAPGTSSLELIKASSAGLGRVPRILLTAAEQLVGLAWSPDRRWLLAVGPAAGQWVFVRAVGAPRIVAVSAVAGAFGGPAHRAAPARGADGFSRVAGWQAVDPFASGS